MLRKLLKYEFKATGRLMLPLLIALLAISGLLAVCVRISGEHGQRRSSTLSPARWASSM